ncbi:MAG: hypothetical protein IPG58_15765 [Acidobacteria bacterium]|nr:hypothetical protein [Acidobacteriota bacterium]
MAIEFKGKKNKQPITCGTILMLSCVLWLEDDPHVASYFEPEIGIIVNLHGNEYRIPIHIWAHHRDATSSFIGLVDAKLEQLFRDHRDIPADVEKQCSGMNFKYIPIRPSDIDTSHAWDYMRQRRAERMLCTEY